jgi:DNA invertase Pin-like site-specific DNA recombinase
MPPQRRLKSVPDEPGRVVLYVRVSAIMGRGGEDFHSPDLQKDGMRRSISLAGLREVGVIDDDIDVSGQSFSRKGLDKVRAMVEAGKVDVIAVYNLSRIGRNLAESLTFIRWLRDHGVAILSVQENLDDTTPEGQFMIGQFLNMAELYGAQIGRGWKAVIDKRARAGYHHGGAPLGYRKLPDHPVMQPDPVMGPVITEVFRRFVAGESTGALMRYVASKRGRPFKREQIRDILCNPVYCGKVALWADHHHRHWSAVPVFLGDGLHEALVDEATFRRARRQLEINSGTAPRHLDPSHSLVRIVRCGAPGCGRQLRKSIDRRRPGGRRSTEKPVPTVMRLHCPAIAAYDGERGCVGVGSPPQADIEAYVLDQVTRYVERLKSDRMAQAEWRGRTARGKADAVRGERELVRIRQEMAKLTKGWQRDIVPDLIYEENMAELRAAEKEMVAQIGASEEVAERPPAREWVDIAGRLLAMWPDLTVPQRNTALRRVVKMVTVGPPAYRGQPVAERTTVEFL